MVTEYASGWATGYNNCFGKILKVMDAHLYVRKKRKEKEKSCTSALSDRFFFYCVGVLMVFNSRRNYIFSI